MHTRSTNDPGIIMDDKGTVAISEKFIDLEGVISRKNPRLLKLIPGFIIRYLKRVVHQDQINGDIWRNRDRFGLDFVEAILKEFGAKITVKGIENIPPAGRWIVASNHPLGGLDGMALMHVVGKVRRDLLFPVNDLLMNLENLKELFIPINKHGSNMGNARLIDNAYASDMALLYFPAGLCSRKQKDGICDLEWKKSFITKARSHKRDVIPCYIDGRNSNWFYNLSRFRTWLGIKTNIEMLYLVDEMYRQEDQSIVITFGKPISYQTFNKTHSDTEWAQKVKMHVYNLKNNPETVFE